LLTSTTSAEAKICAQTRHTRGDIMRIYSFALPVVGERLCERVDSLFISFFLFFFVRKNDVLTTSRTTLYKFSFRVLTDDDDDGMGIKHTRARRSGWVIIIIILIKLIDMFVLWCLRAIRVHVLKCVNTRWKYYY